jgi:hypothetical protein
MSQLASLTTMPKDPFAIVIDFLKPHDYVKVVQLSKTICGKVVGILETNSTVQRILAYKISFHMAHDFFLLRRQHPIEQFDLNKYNDEARTIVVECICTSIRKEDLTAICKLTQTKHFSFFQLFKILDTNFGAVSPFHLANEQRNRSRTLPSLPSPFPDQKLIDEIFKKLRKGHPNINKETATHSIRKQLSALDQEPFALAPLYENPKLFNSLYYLFEAVTAKILPQSQQVEHRSLTPSPHRPMIEISEVKENFVHLQPSPRNRRRPTAINTH